MLEKIAGIHAVLETILAEERKIEKLYFVHGSRKGALKEIEERAVFSNIPLDFVAPTQLTKLCGHGHHQGVLALARPYHFISLKELLKVSIENNTPPFLLAIDQVQDPRNLGAILRNAEGAGVDGVIITTKKTSPVSPVVVQTSAGASEHMKISRIVNLVSTLEYLKTLGIWVIGTDAETSQTIYDIDGKEAVVLVIGSEGKGLRRLVSRTCDWIVQIPMSGRIKSLNVSSAAAILLYEIRRQRSFS